MQPLLRQGWFRPWDLSATKPVSCATLEMSAASGVSWLSFQVALKSWALRVEAYHHCYRYFPSCSRNLVDFWSLLRVFSSPWFPWRLQLPYVHPVHWSCRFLKLSVTQFEIEVVYIIYEFSLHSWLPLLNKSWVAFAVLTVSTACWKPTYINNI